MSAATRSSVNKSFRLNKIGKNPHLVSERETLESDCRQMNDIVRALSAAETESLCGASPVSWGCRPAKSHDRCDRQSWKFS